jgi:hypothetical protein
MIENKRFDFIRKYWNQKPLQFILVASAFFRLLAVIFSKGYGMHDDHFLVIEAAQSWVDGHDYNYWLPTITKTVTKPTGHSLLYPGLHYLFFRILQSLGIYDPQIKMYFVRLIHAAWSMITVYFGYKMAYRINGIKAAKAAGILLGLLFFMPIMSVRNLVEFVCIPPLMTATWLVINNVNSKKTTPFLFAGFMLGLAFSIRFQTASFIIGLGLALLIQKQWKQIIEIIFGFIICIAIVQGGTDMVIWHKPFMEMGEYIRYNIENAETYGSQKWYNYILLVSGIIIPPISIFILFGFLRNWKKHLILFLPAFVFFVFHSSFPNKQERFILPAFPFIITLGIAGWYNFMEQSAFWQNRKKLFHACWIFFWSLNIIPLIFVSAAYSHRSRVESMVYLSTKSDFRNLIIEESNHSDFAMPPLFYLRHWISNYSVTSVFTVDSLDSIMHLMQPKFQPNYVVFNQPDNLEERLRNFKKVFPGMKYEATIEPSFVDKVMHTLNKHNANFTSYIYRLGN